MLARVADEWPATHPSTVSADLQEHERYTAAADAAFAAVIGNGPDLPDRLKSHNVRHGLRVMARYCYIGAFIARESGSDFETIETALGQPDTFEQLRLISQNPIKVSRRIETNYGIVPYNYPLDEHTAKKADLTPSGIQLRSFPHARAVAVLDAREQGHEYESGECEAQRRGVLEPCFNSMVSIALKDTHLIRRSMNS